MTSGFAALWSMKGGDGLMDEDSRRRYWRNIMGLEKECKPVIVRSLDILKRLKTRKGERTISKKRRNKGDHHV